MFFDRINVKAKNGRYEILVSLEEDIVEKIHNNFINALQRSKSFRWKLLDDPTANRTLTNTFYELLADWLAHRS